MRSKRLLTAGLVVILALTLASSGAQTQQQQLEAIVSIQNICQQGTLVIQVIQLTLNGTPLATQFLLPGKQINPGETASFSLKVSAAPNDLAISGTLNNQSFAFKVDQLELNQPVTDREHCLQVVVSLSGQQPGQQPGQKPIQEGQSLDQVLQSLQALGIPISQEGSQASPKLPNLSDPMLLRVISGFSAQLLFVSAPGSLRAVITWDRPTVDLDLIVIGLPGGFCFQLTPPGVLAEICDRAPFGPVLGVVFAVVIINWSATPTAYVLSLSP